MKHPATMLTTLVLAAAASCVAPALAADAPAKQLTPQQQKMATCSHQAGEKKLKGDERRTFLSGCLKRDGAVTASVASAPADTAAQPEKKQSCRAEAKRQHLAGSARKDFISSCAQGGREVAATR